MNLFKKLLPLLIIIGLSFWAIKPLLSSGFFPIHDDTQVQRVFEMSKSLKDGMLPVRWVSDLGYGYGYPIFNFYDPLPYYVGGIMGLATDALFATKLMMILGIIFAGISMYFLAKEFWGENGAILSSLFYMYAPYHAVDIYVRGDVAEFWAYAFIPLVFYGIWKLYKTNEWRYLIVSSISFAAIILSHNLTALIVSPFIVLFMIYLFYKKRWQRSILALLIGVLLSSFYWLPAVLEINFTNVFSIIGGGSDFRNNFVCLSQLWNSPWGFGGSAPGCIDGISFMIGKYHIILALILSFISVIFFMSRKYNKIFEKDKEKLLLTIFSLIGFLISVFFTLDISKPVWDAVTPFTFLQYPWRFLIMAVFFSSFISGSFLWYINKFYKNKNVNILIGIIIFVVFIFLSEKFFVPQTILNKKVNDYVNNYSLKWTTSKISDEYMPKNFIKPQDFYQIPDVSNLNSNDLAVVINSKKTQELDLSLNVYKQGSYILPIAYFPSWKASLDGQAVNLTSNNRGMIINLPQGVHSLVITFKQTPIELMGNLLTLAGILSLFLGIIYVKVKK